jgi:hypothetical protein
MSKTEWVKTPEPRGEYLSADGQWMVSFGMGHIHPDHQRIWSLYRRTGEYSKTEGEILEVTLGHHFTAEAAMAAAGWTEDERKARYREARAELAAILQAKYASK